MRSRDMREEIRIFVIRACRRRRHDDYFEVIPRVAIIFCRSLHVRIGKHSLPTGIDFTFDSLALILFPCFLNSDRPFHLPVYIPVRGIISIFRLVSIFSQLFIFLSISVGFRSFRVSANLSFSFSRLISVATTSNIKRLFAIILLRC